MRAARSSWLQKPTSIKHAFFNMQEDDPLLSPPSLPWPPLLERNSSPPLQHRSLRSVKTHLCLSEIDLSAIRHMAFSFKRALPSTPQFAAKKVCPSPFPPSAPSTPQPTPTITPLPQLLSPLPDHRPSSTSSIDELKTPSSFSFGCPSPFELPTMTAPPFIPASKGSRH